MNCNDAARNSYVQPYFIARVYVALGDRDQAFVQPEKAYEQRDAWLSRVKLDPAFDSLKEDSRFADLVRRMGLPE